MFVYGESLILHFWKSTVITLRFIPAFVHGYKSRNDYCGELFTEPVAQARESFGYFLAYATGSVDIRYGFRKPFPAKAATGLCVLCGYSFFNRKERKGYAKTAKNMSPLSLCKVSRHHLCRYPFNLIARRDRGAVFTGHSPARLFYCTIIQRMCFF